jgi:peptide/nickel transport system substrate-binding protein
MMRSGALCASIRLLGRLACGAALALAGLALAAGCGRTPKNAGGLREVPRNRTLILDCPDSGIGTGQYTDWDSFNPFIPGGISRTGHNFLYEPLYFYNVYRDETIPWIAESHEYNADFTEVTVRLRKGVEWSDGEPWTARDLVFTVNMLKENAPALLYSLDMANAVKEAVATDDLTARITLRSPNPRFVFNYFTSRFCMGIPIVPKHIWQGKDPKTFKNLDIARGWPVVSGPYGMALSTPEKKVWDLRTGWWATKTGFRRLPKVERIIYQTYKGEPQRVQSLVADELDSSLEIRPANAEVLLQKNPRITTWSGREKPYGYLDHWPVCLGFNDLEAPCSDPEFRRAVALAIDRHQLVEVGLRGAGGSTLVPFPEFPPMKRFVDGVGDIFDKYEHGACNPAKSAEIMARLGWSKDGKGFWSKGGARASLVIDGYVYIYDDFAPVLVEQLRRAGFDASFRSATDCYSRMSTGQAQAFLCGTSASVRDPYPTLSHYHSRYIQPTGKAAPIFWRWKNERYDELVDRMALLPADDPAFMALYREAMDIWLRELPSIPVLAWHQRPPYNETYWKGWPTAADPYVNGAYWHKTWLLVLLRLEPTQ